MKAITLEWESFFKGEILPRKQQKEDILLKSLTGFGLALAFSLAIQAASPLPAGVIVAADLGIARALEPFKLIIAECADPICFIGGAMGLYRISIGQREDGFKQVLNAAMAQAGFFIWPKLQAAIRAGVGV